MRLYRLTTIILAGVSLMMITGCGGSKKKELTVLLRMMPAQERYYRDEVVKKFEDKYNCKVNITSFENQWDIERMLKLDAGKSKPEIGIVKTPFEMTRVLAGKGYIAKLTDVIDSAVVMKDMAEYHPLAAGLGFVDNEPYYIPRKLETRIMFYLKSKVKDAISKFPSYKNDISKELKALNGYGLPAEYKLEENPAEWDFYDLYVAGAVWSREKYSDGVKTGRIAHRGAKYEGTALFLVDRALQLGASKEDILKLDSDYMAEMYLWENMFIRNGLYNQGMWQDPWRGSNIYNGIKDGKVFLAYLQQIDCFLVHGWENDPGMPTYLPDKDDMGLSVVPKAVSFELDNKGKPMYEGDRAISTGGWWWGIPKSCPDADLAYKFARFVTSKDIHAEECSRFGIIPVRKDILNNLPSVFEQGWVGEIFRVSVDQVKIQMGKDEIATIPLVKQYSRVAQNIIDAWYKLCVEHDKDKGMDLSMMKEELGGDFVKKQKEILGDDYPEKQ